jgi:hypothetical protein
MTAAHWPYFCDMTCCCAVLVHEMHGLATLAVPRTIFPLLLLSTASLRRALQPYYHSAYRANQGTVNINVMQSRLVIMEGRPAQSMASTVWRVVSPETFLLPLLLLQLLVLLLLLLLLILLLQNQVHEHVLTACLSEWQSTTHQGKLALTLACRF